MWRIPESIRGTGRINERESKIVQPLNRLSAKRTRTSTFSTFSTLSTPIRLVNAHVGWRRWLGCGMRVGEISRRRDEKRISLQAKTFAHISTRCFSSLSSSYSRSATSTAKATQSTSPSASQCNAMKERNSEDSFAFDKVLKHYIVSGDITGMLKFVIKYQLTGKPLTVEICNQILKAAVKHNLDETHIQSILNLYQSNELCYNAKTYSWLLSYNLNNERWEEMEKLWQTLKMNREFITDANIQCMVKAAIARNLPKKKVDEYLQAARDVSLNLSPYTYRFFLRYYTPYPDDFFSLFKQYMEDVKNKKTGDAVQTWFIGLKQFVRKRNKEFIHEIVRHLVRHPEAQTNEDFWRQIAWIIAPLGSAYMVYTILNRISTLKHIKPPQEVYEYCSYSLCFRATNQDTFFTNTFTEQDLPPNQMVLDLWNVISTHAAQFDVQLNSKTRNYALYALALARQYNVWFQLFELCTNDSSFTLNIFGYMSMILVSNVSNVNLDSLDTLKRKALQTISSSSFGSATVKKAKTMLYQVLMCAYAKSEAPHQTTRLHSLVKEMVEQKIEPFLLHHTLRAFYLNSSAMDKLLDVLKQHWPHIKLNHHFYKLYFMFYMLEQTKSGTFSLKPPSTSVSLNALRKILLEAVQACEAKFGRLSTGVFIIWNQLLSKHGNEEALRVVYDVVVKLTTEGRMDMYPDANTALCHIWRNIAGIYCYSQQWDHVFSLLDEMKAKGCKPTLNFYLRLMDECKRAENHETILLKLYELMLGDGIKPTSDIIYIMLGAIKTPASITYLRSEARKYGIFLRRNVQ